MLKEKFLQQLQEEAAGGSVGAGSIAVVQGSLLSNLAKRSLAKAPKPETLKLNDDTSFKTQNKKQRQTLKQLLAKISKFTESLEPNDASSIMDKLRGMERDNATVAQDVVVFGLEDDNGNVVKVSIPTDQSGDFEVELRDQIKLNNGEGQPAIEIAELLYTLKDRFDIVNVEWSDIEENEEQLPDEDQIEADAEANAELDTEMVPDEEVDNSEAEQAESLLGQIITMMKADAQARQTEAEAKKAEAEAKKAQAAAKAAYAKVRQEEQILDMEDHEKAQKEENKEAKKLAKLAKWRHEISNGSLDNDEILPGSDIETDPEYAFSVHDDDDDEEIDIRVKKEENNEQSLPAATAAWRDKIPSPIPQGSKGTSAEFMNVLLNRLKGDR